MIVKEIKFKDTYCIRNKILRPNRPMDTCRFEGDEDDLTFHLGAFVDNKLVSVASFYFENHPEIPASHQFRLRGMATLPEFQGKGLSSALLRRAFPQIVRNQSKTLWCNARVSAEGFYEKVGFETLSPEFNIPDVGPQPLQRWAQNHGQSHVLLQA